LCTSQTRIPAIGFSPHTITKCNANINMHNTIAGSIIPRGKLNIC
jgi:hypothetical protein